MSDHPRAAPEVVVVGAGLAGLACAMDLSRAGRRVTLLEADHRATGSVQGALASGARAAREVLADLSRG